MSKNITKIQSLTDYKVDAFLKETTKWLKRIDISEESGFDELLEEYPDDINLVKSKTGDILDFYDDLSSFYEEKLTQVGKQFIPLKKLIEKTFKLNNDINWFYKVINKITTALDPFFDCLDFLPENSYYYSDELGDSFSKALKQISKEKRTEILGKIQKEYLNPKNKDMYIYTMGIVLDDHLGKKRFNEIYRERIILELENFDLSEYTRTFLENELKSLNKKLK